MACFTPPDVEVFHPVSGLEQSGVEALRKAEELWFSTLSGPVRRRGVRRLPRTGWRLEGVAFSHALVRIRATLATGEPLDTTARVRHRLPRRGQPLGRSPTSTTSIPFDTGVTEGLS